MFDDFNDSHTHFIPSVQQSSMENVVPVADFISKKMRALNKSLRTSSDNDERQEIIAQIILCSASLSVLQLACYMESHTLIDTSKELFRGI